jgi:MoaA/NifB/PqqE/SkfB family radical SAM enzyme
MDIKAGNLPVPLQVQLIISDLCNHNCNFCAYRMEGYESNQMFGEKNIEGVINNNPNRMIPLEKALEILEDCADMGVKALQYTGGGEPTVHPKHADIFEKTVDLGMDLALVTNGTKMTERTRKALIEGGKWIRVSVDAGCEKTYSTVREVKPVMWERVWRNIARLSEERNSAKETDLIIGLGFVITPDNWKETPAFAERAVEAGADNIRISAMFATEDVHTEYYEECAKILSHVKKQYGDKIKIFDLFSDRVEDLEQASPDYNHCGYMKLNVYIGGDQNIYTCCNNAYNVSGLAGSIKNQTFKEYWSSDEAKKYYGNFDASKCARCMFNNKNKFINYLLLDNPQHVNYV